MNAHVVAVASAAPDSDTDTVSGLAFVLGLWVLVAVVVIVLARQAAQIYRARLTGRRDHELRNLLERSTSVQERQALALERTEARLDGLSEQLSRLERVLKEVE